jgi:phosphoribosylformylglycinamidine synthase
MSQVKVCVLFGFGINCDRETAAVFDMVGGTSERVHVNRLVQGERSLSEFDILAVPGGFSFGDHLGSGRLLGNRLRFALREQLQQFVTNGKPIIGICNGFQALVKTGLLPGPANASLEPDLVQRASLTLNNTGRYEDRWVTLEFDSESPCIWTKNIERIECPVRHGEGRFVMPAESDLDQLASTHQLTVRYVDPVTETGKGIQDDILPFPLSPNGSMRNIAGICDATGLVFGPHASS